jgi:hypothetical protein
MSASMKLNNEAYLIYINVYANRFKPATGAGRNARSIRRVEVFDEPGGSLVEVLARVADLDIARDHIRAARTLRQHRE